MKQIHAYLVALAVAAAVAVACFCLGRATGTPTYKASSELPVLVGNLFVDPGTGEVLGMVLKNPTRWPPTPIKEKPGLYKLPVRWSGEHYVVDVSSRTIVEHNRSGIRVSRDGQTITRSGQDGGELWSAAMKGKHFGHAVWYPKAYFGRLFVAHRQGISALDWRTGEVLWESEGPIENIVATGGLVLALGRSADVSKDLSWLVGRDVRDGSEVFKARLSTRETLYISEAEGFFLVRKYSWSKPGFSALVDRSGKIRFKQADDVLSVVPLEDGLLIQSRARIARVGADQATVWEISLANDGFVSVGGFVPLPGGDILAFAYEGISDSRVKVAARRTGRRQDSLAGTLRSRRSGTLAVSAPSICAGPRAKAHRGELGEQRTLC